MQMRTQKMHPSKKREQIVYRVLSLSILFSILAVVIFLIPNYWSSIQTIWSHSLWLHWIIFAILVLAALFSIILWIRKSQGTTRTSRIHIVVLSTLAIGIIISLLGTYHILPDTWSTTVSTIFAGVGVMLMYLQLVGVPSFIGPAKPDPASTNPARVLPSSVPQQSPVLPPDANAHVTPSPSGQSSAEEKDFFISYANTDLSYAAWIDAQLRTAGYSTILRAYDFRFAYNFIHELNEATQIAKQTILVLSPDYLQEFEKHPEWMVAFHEDMSGKKRKLMPIYVRACPQRLKGFLALIQPLDLVGKPEEQARELLLHAVAPDSVSLRPTTPPPFPPLS